MIRLLVWEVWFDCQQTRTQLNISQTLTRIQTVAYHYVNRLQQLEARDKNG